MLRADSGHASAGRLVAAAAAVALGLAAVSTPAEARKIRFPVWRSSAPAHQPVATTRPRAAVYATTGTSSAARTRAGAGEGDMARLAGPEAAGPRSAALVSEQNAADEKTTRRKAWLDFCQPQLAPPDRYGIERWTYAHDGCQFGRTE